MKRESNIELMRIIFIYGVVIYHAISYTGLFYAEYAAGLPLSFVGSSIYAETGVYGFMSISAYYLIKKDDNNVFCRFVPFAFQAGILFLLRYWVVDYFLGVNNIKGGLLEDFFLKGAWWYVVAYEFILLVSPIYNRIIKNWDNGRLKRILLVLGILCVISELIYYPNVLSDIECVSFTYFMVGYVEKNKFTFFTSRKKLILGFFILVTVLHLNICFIEYSGLFSDAQLAYQIILRYTGKNSPLYIFCGIFMFYLFKAIPMKQNPRINRLSGGVLYIFLLHESVLCVLWSLGFLTSDTKEMGLGTTYLRIAVYVILCAVNCYVISLVCSPVDRFIRKKTMECYKGFLALKERRQNGEK